MVLELNCTTPCSPLLAYIHTHAPSLLPFFSKKLRRGNPIFPDRFEFQPSASMSLRYASRVLMRAAAQAMRARQPAVSKPMSGAVKPSPSGAANRPQARQFSGGLTESTEKAIAVEKMKRRRAEKSENVMHLVCWGPN